MKRFLGLATMVAIVAAFALPTFPANAQFAGCADELGEEYGARFKVYDVRDTTLRVAAVGVDGFDPQLTILDPSGKAIACSEDSDNALDYGAGLPSVGASASANTAAVEVPVSGSEPARTFEILVASEDYQSGEFALIIDGVQVFGADDVDRYTMTTNEGQVEAEVPMGFYAVNIERPDQTIDPVLTFRFGDDFVRVCRKSSSAALCDGEEEDLTGYTVTVEGNSAVLNGDDAMLYFEAGGQVASFEIEVSSYQSATFGPYVLVIHSGVGYPEGLRG